MTSDTRTSDRRKPASRNGRGPRVTVDELVNKSRTVFDRVVPILERAASKVRSKLARKELRSRP